jgi:DNA-directed RNA polymerase specialized sigma24 family protein
MQMTTFAEWYRDAQPGLLESVLRAVNRRAVAEDALDEAFEKAFARWERVQSMRSPNGWVYRVAVNAARRQLSREVREGERLAFATTTAPEPPPGGEAWLVVATLPVRQRTAVVLRHVGGMTEAEVASAMGVTRSTVSSTLASAYTTLGRLLAEPTPTKDAIPMNLSLALALACDDGGCDVELLDGGTRRTTWSDAVRNTVKVRPGDLVAVDGDQVVWRWWGGTVVAVDGETATIERNITQREPGDPRTGRIDVHAPADLDVAAGDRVWFGTDGDRKVIVAAGSPEAAVTRLPDVLQVLG